jgi:4-alpha-glucanotransferase
MNLPARAEGNWEWRALPGAFDARVTERLGALTRTYGRARDPEQT